MSLKFFTEEQKENMKSARPDWSFIEMKAVSTEELISFLSKQLQDTMNSYHDGLNFYFGRERIEKYKEELDKYTVSYDVFTRTIRELITKLESNK